MLFHKRYQATGMMCFSTLQAVGCNTCKLVNAVNKLLLCIIHKKKLSRIDGVFETVVHSSTNPKYFPFSSSVVAGCSIWGASWDKVVKNNYTCSQSYAVLFYSVDLI